jgi:hypothetical protein
MAQDQDLDLLGGTGRVGVLAGGERPDQPTLGLRRQLRVDRLPEQLERNRPISRARADRAAASLSAYAGRDVFGRRIRRVSGRRAGPTA